MKNRFGKNSLWMGIKWKALQTWENPGHATPTRLYSKGATAWGRGGVWCAVCREGREFRSGCEMSGTQDRGKSKESSWSPASKLLRALTTRRFLFSLTLPSHHTPSLRSYCVPPQDPANPASLSSAPHCVRSLPGLSSCNGSCLSLCLCLRSSPIPASLSDLTGQS